MTSPQFLPGDDSGSSSPTDAILMTGRRQLLAEALLRRGAAGSRALAMFVEAIRSIGRREPESLYVAGFELREFMNELPLVYDLPMAKKETINGEVRVLVDQWKTSRPASACFTADSWSGIIDVHLTAMLSRVDRFVVWWDEWVPTKRAQSAHVITQMAGVDRPIIQALLDSRTKSWAEMLRFFNRYAHHDVVPNEADFAGMLDRLEVFLAESLAPPTFKDQDEIDSLIAEGETPIDR